VIDGLRKGDGRVGLVLAEDLSPAERESWPWLLERFLRNPKTVRQHLKDLTNILKDVQSLAGGHALMYYRLTDFGASR
jgi:hypothetical protein